MQVIMNVLNWINSPSIAKNAEQRVRQLLFAEELGEPSEFLQYLRSLTVH